MANGLVFTDRNVVETLVENGLVVVDVADGDANGGRAGEGRPPGVRGQNGNLWHGVRFAVDVLASGDESGAPVDVKPVGMSVGRLEDGISDDGIVAQVAIQGGELEDGGARVGHLQHVGVVHGLLELRRVVVGVGDAQIEGTRRVQGRAALIGGRHDQRHVGLHLSVQRQRNDHVNDVVTRGQTEMTFAPVQRHVDVGVFLLGVRVVDGDAGNELARLGVLRYLGSCVVAQEDQIDGRLVVVDVRHADGHKGRRLQGLDARVAGHDDQLVDLFGLKVEGPVDGDDASARVDDEDRVAVALSPVDRVGDPAVVSGVRVGGEHLEDAGADGRVLGHRCKVATLVEYRLVVVDVLDGDVDGHEAAQRRVAAVQGFDH